MDASGTPPLVAMYTESGYVDEVSPPRVIIGLSIHADADIASQMRQAGAVAYLTKAESRNRILGVIRDCMRVT